MPTFKLNRVLPYISAFIAIVLILFALFRDNAKLITLHQLSDLLQKKEITSVVYSKQYLYLTTKNKVYKIAASQTNPAMFQNIPVEENYYTNFLLYSLLFILIVGGGTFFVRWYQKKETKEIKRKKTQPSAHQEIEEDSSLIQPIKSDVTFEDVGGIEDVKVELEEIIDFLKNPLKYKKFGAYLPRGVLLVGPPGVGKTMIAKAVANKANVPFFYQSGASFVQIYVGMGAKRVHELFTAAKNNAPSIIFIDEIDAVGKKRDGQRNDEREATLNQLLTEMDGFEGSSGVMVIAATNKIEVLDSALLRAGRFDRRIFVQLPTKEERVAIVSKYLQRVPHQLDIQIVANMTVGFNGASLAALVNEAALLALRQNEPYVTIEHFDLVKDKVIFGKKKLQILTSEQKEYRLWYQSAKVVCATYFDLPFEKLMLSNTSLLPSSDEPLIQYELEARLKMHLSGIVACDMKFGQHSSNVKEDLDEVKKLLKKMLNEYGMGEKLLPYEQENEMMMQKLYEETKILLTSLEMAIKQVESILYEKESITKEETKRYIDAIL
ncbi:Cell division protein FtsH [hydrothermal vent metagenome]|uniref:Cell division protein FtsH n=1 Tax=hydrothermal vent metagenome TaxID=652676 RepID=A0A1W1D2P7_9ZZZZ